MQGADNEGVRDTAFSVDGSHLVSVARDMTVKLTEVATQRFIDNVTSITPCALKGRSRASPGIRSLTRWWSAVPKACLRPIVFSASQSA